MKIARLGMFMGAAGALLLASQAMADTFIPEVGSTTFKLTDGSGFYDNTAITNGTDPYIARGTPPKTGDQDFTAFRITSYKLNDGAEIVPVNSIVGVFTFLEYATDFTPVVPGLIYTAQLTDSSRTHTTAVDTTFGRTTIGRFFLYENTNFTGANPPEFDAAGNQADDVLFNQVDGTLPGVTGGNIDKLGDFTTGTLLATGSLADDEGADDGIITQLFQAFGTTNGANFLSTLSGRFVIDGGVWFDAGITSAAFGYKLHTIDPTDPSWAFINNPANGGPTEIREDVFDGNWLGSSEDPITVVRVGTNVVPEPATAGLSVLALSGLAFAARRRRA